MDTHTLHILRIEADYSGYQAFQLPMKDLLLNFGKNIPPKKLLHFSLHNLPLAPFWSDISARFSPIQGVTKPNHSIPDLTLWRSATLVISHHAKEQLGDTLEELGELLPVTTPQGPIWIFNCLTLVAADEKKSKRIEEQGQVLEVERIVFRQSDVGANLLFKTDYDGCRSLYCTDAFRDKVAIPDSVGCYFTENEL